ncbi:hypothetical protein [Microtetraspora sp. NBRC 16547]|uniref:hypothetical protein n=1 Tax=Microtetraspora sp. NBRC 16547 TaxID=3030993 RepID=UPI0024A5A9A0|nr:hypothetical protein [Microtetraspora sp. NBRC 16547]GLX01605.1 oxidoreductase [Microtetraspora sp. NBRC 16547]
MGRSRPFWRLNPAERKLWDAYPSGAWVDLRETEKDDPATGASWGRERVVRAQVIAALLLGMREGRPGEVPGVRLAGARIVGDLNLSDAVFTSKLHLLNCYIPGAVSLNDARTRGVRFRGCDIRRFKAGRAVIDGLFDLDGSTIRAGVRLDNTRVTGQFRLSRATIGTPEDVSRGSESFLEDTRAPYSREETETRGLARSHTALWAGGLTVDGGAFLRGLRSTGTLRLIGARFNSGIYLQRSVIATACRPAGAYAVHADHLQATTVEFSEGFTAEGGIRLRGARITGVLSFNRATLKAPGRALHLSHMQVDELILTPASVEGEINLGYSRIGVLLDRPDCYPGAVHLNETTYESLRGPARLSDRLAWLRRDPDGYRPQPYEQLAAYFRRIGHESDARRVLLAKQRSRRRTLRLPGRLWGWLLDVMVGYGYRPWLAGVWATLLLALGTAVFSAHHPSQIGLDERRSFSPLLYTLDLLAPVSLFDQRGAWEPVGWTQWLAGGLIAAGWILATALIAGATRVLRPSGPS